MIFGDACGGLRLRIVIEVRIFERGDRIIASRVALALIWKKSEKLELQ
ncbi:MAG: hypothetical protein V7K21_14890 [Nostoc sp.]